MVMLPYIHDELLISILIRLNPKTLVKLLLVSKSRYSLITSTDFISQHLLHHNHPKTHLELFIQSDLGYSLRRVGDTCDDTDLITPKTPNGSPYITIGSCNGVVCLYSREDYTPCLLNPAINKILNTTPIPVSVPIPCSRNQNVVLGFGFSSVTNDYKIVAMTYLSRQRGYRVENPQTHIYSVNDRTWRNIESPVCLCDGVTLIYDEIYVEGIIFFIVQRWVPSNDTFYKKKGVYEILSTFDVNTEAFREIGLPCLCKDDLDQRICLGVICDSLVLIHFVDEEEREVHVWIMNDFNVEESWYIFYKIDLYSLSVRSDLFDELIPTGFMATSSGCFIMLYGKNWSDIVVFGDAMFLDMEVFIHTESLVLLHKFSKPSWLSLTSNK